jgi:hypothetical protein
MHHFPTALARWTLVVLLLFAAAAAQASTSNKWRLQFSGGADSDGVIVLRITPRDGEAITAEIAIEDGTGENNVAKAVVDGLKEQLPKDHYHVERDDWEDVLVKKRLGDENFSVEIVSNTVKGVRINPDRE